MHSAITNNNILILFCSCHNQNLHPNEKTHEFGFVRNVNIECEFVRVIERTSERTNEKRKYIVLPNVCRSAHPGRHRFDKSILKLRFTV